MAAKKGKKPFFLFGKKGEDEEAKGNPFAKKKKKVKKKKKGGK